MTKRELLYKLTYEEIKKHYTNDIAEDFSKRCIVWVCGFDESDWKQQFHIFIRNDIVDLDDTIGGGKTATGRIWEKYYKLVLVLKLNK